MNEELEKQFENVEKSSEDFLNNNKNVNYEPLYILQSDLNLLFESSANISNSINVFIFIFIFISIILNSNIIYFKKLFFSHIINY